MRNAWSPKAFTRKRLLPLPKLIAALLSMRSSSVQVGLDSFFGSLGSDGDLQHVVSDRAFAKARDNLSWSGFQRLNTFVVNLASKMGLVPRWQGLRVVAGDASAFMPALRAYTPAIDSKKTAAAPSQHLFTLYLPGAELTLLSELHGLQVGERQMLFEALSHLLPGDVLVLDRGYFKRLKHVQKIESASGLSQQAVNIDVQAKTLADNLNTLVCMGALAQDDLRNTGKQCNRSYAGNCLQRSMPRLVLGLGCVAALLEKAFDLLCITAYKPRLGRKAKRPKNQVKPHPKPGYKA